MTEKKRNIIDAAAQLFSSNGFSATSTSKIAEKAGVSEGLIFRHFGNKSALLDTILAEGEQRLKAIIPILFLNPILVKCFEKLLNFLSF